MNSNLFYKITAWAYDLLDVIYFRNQEKSPRNAVLCAVSDKERILDLCTGTATNAINIADRYPNSRIVGIDLSREMLRIAREKIKKQGIQNIKLCYMDATKLKFRNHCFDKILISLVLHELEEDLAKNILLEAKRVLKDNGEIVITEWEISKIWWQKILFFPLHCLEPKPYRSFIKKDLTEYFKQYGLEIVEEIHCDYSKVLRVKKITKAS